MRAKANLITTTTREWVMAAAVGFAAALLVVIVATTKPAYAATTFSVNSTGDAKDRNINGVCDSSRDRGKQCTLRAAIEEANETPGADKINFKIGGTASVKTIKPAKALPTITDPVTINGYTQAGASANTLAEGNNAVLKVQLNGTNAGEFTDGLTITAANSTIKGLVINRFRGDGVDIFNPGATENKVEGNFIGTNADGSGSLGNDRNGVDITNAPNNTIGGTQPAQRNVISGNDRIGVDVFFSGARENKVEGNFIGTNADGSGSLGNGSSGVNILSASDNTIGGTDTGAGNQISANGSSGVQILGSETTDNKVEGNRIGHSAAGRSGPTGNSSAGVLSSGANNTIGGTDSEAGNQISGNSGDGVLVSSQGTGITILSNAIFANGGLGIDLSPNGVTNNDDDDPDTGANNLQNFPVISGVIRDATPPTTTIGGTLNSNPNQSFTVQCFVAGETADVSGHGEGETLLTQDTSVTTNASGDAGFQCVLPEELNREVEVSATATNTATGDTSEFSATVGLDL
jgi:hypothetical protein